MEVSSEIQRFVSLFNLYDYRIIQGSRRRIRPYIVLQEKKLRAFCFVLCYFHYMRGYTHDFRCFDSRMDFYNREILEEDNKKFKIKMKSWRQLQNTCSIGLSNCSSVNPSVKLLCAAKSLDSVVYFLVTTRVLRALTDLELHIDQLERG